MSDRHKHYKGCEIGVEPIKMENHYSNQDIDIILYDINDMLYYFRNLYLNWDVRKLIEAKLIVSADKLKRLNFPMAKSNELNARRNEILEKMRVIYKNLSVVGYTNDINWCEIVRNMGKYKLGQFIKSKKDSICGLTPSSKHKWLEDNLLFYKAYGYDESIESIQNEIIKSYKIPNKGNG